MGVRQRKVGGADKFMLKTHKAHEISGVCNSTFGGAIKIFRTLALPTSNVELSFIFGLPMGIV
jgi:hypothetical protein